MWSLPASRAPVWILVAAVELGILLAIPAPANPDKPGKAGGIRTAAAQLRGSGPPIDLVQDYVGARDLARGRDAYGLLTQEYASVGLTWPVPHRSTHPPTAFLLVLPVAWLPWKAGAAIWMVLMLLALAAAYWAFGARAGPALALAPLTLVWPPGGWSMGQLTPLWLLGIAIAWGAALALLLVLDAGVVGRYLKIARIEGRAQAARHENAAMLWAANHHYGAAGIALAAALIAAVVVVSLRRVWKRDELDR